MVHIPPRIGEWSDFDGLRAIWQERLPAVVRAAAHSDFYRSRFGPDVSPVDLGRLSGLPLTTKADLRANHPFGMVAVPRRRLASYHESSGTSPGQATASFHTEADWAEMLDRFSRGRYNLSDSDTVLVRVPYAMVTIGHQVHAAARAAGALTVPADARSTAMTYPRVLRLLRDLEVTVAAALPTEPLLWAACARLLDSSPRDHAPRLRTLIATGEPLSRARRDRIARIWGCDVTVSYGNSECGSNLAGECPEGTLHLWADRYLPEVLDPATGTASPEGSGRLVLTTLFREAMPLVRYDTGDAVELSYEPCPCGWALPRVRVLGRWEQGVVLNGRRVFSSQVEEAVYRLPPELDVLFWRAVEDRGTLRVRVEAAGSAAPDVAPALRGELARHLGVAAEVEAVALGTLVPLEELTRESHIAKPRYLSSADDGSPGLSYPASAAAPRPHASSEGARR
ncbi:phenylacetate--CoA ligase family protein [Streptomonospora nanhaiensis]|uniref:phenylacetate--CoA ligase family protein n=1 Tax=Streptomonospora nanhaiensis TaxID=1323731 RepID=UPI001C990025|nr:AMP-binding protein [Streptomonospora nanhaiensis]MBX9389737.1 AMP-binding protein [Streptomonospora nanhaiensis]